MILSHPYMFPYLDCYETRFDIDAARELAKVRAGDDIRSDGWPYASAFIRRWRHPMSTDELAKRRTPVCLRDDAHAPSVPDVQVKFVLALIAAGEPLPPIPVAL